MFSSSLRCSCSRMDHPASRCTCRYTWHPPCARCTQHLQLLGSLAGFPRGTFFAPSSGVLAVICLGIHVSLTNLQLPFSAGKCAPRWFLPALLVWSLLAVRVDFDPGKVIPILHIATRTRNPLWLLRVLYHLAMIDSDDDSHYELCISTWSRLNWDHQNCVGISFGFVTSGYGILLYL